VSNTATFAGLPHCTDFYTTADIAIIGIPHGTPYDPGQASHSADAPAVIRQASAKYAHVLEHYDFDFGGTLLNEGKADVVDCVDVPGDPLDPVGNRRRVTEATRALLNTGAVPIVLGGDDSVPIPFMRAYEGQGPLTVVQVDAHLDWRHEVNGITEGFSSTMRRASEMPWVNKLIQAGLRGVGSARPKEVAAARAYGAKILTAKELAEGGVEPVLDLVPQGTPCLLTVDCDGLDPSIMPAVNAPAPGGLSYWWMVDLLHGLAQKADIRGIDLVEFCPEKDINGLAGLAAVRIVCNMIAALARANPLLHA